MKKLTIRVYNLSEATWPDHSLRFTNYVKAAWYFIKMGTNHQRIEVTIGAYTAFFYPLKLGEYGSFARDHSEPHQEGQDPTLAEGDHLFFTAFERYRFAICYGVNYLFNHDDLDKGPDDDSAEAELEKILQGMGFTLTDACHIRKYAVFLEG